MVTSARIVDDLTRSTDEELMASKTGGELGVDKLIQSLPTGSGATDESGLVISSAASDSLSVALPKLSRSVVSVSLSVGGTIVFTSSGIPIDRSRTSAIVLTSANFVKTMRKKIKPGTEIWIEVRDAFNNVTIGCLEHYDFHNGIALVSVTGFLDVCEVHLRHGVEIQPPIVLVAIQLTESGGVNPVKVILTKDSRLSIGDEVLCKAGDGGPLFDGDGNFAGMNLLSDNGSCDFVPRSVIVERLEPFEKIKELRARRQRERYVPIICPAGKYRLREEHYIDLKREMPSLKRQQLIPRGPSNERT